MPDDRPAQDDGIEVTPEMVRRATRALWASGLRNDWSPSDSVIVKEILVAALKGHPTKRRSGPNH